VRLQLPLEAVEEDRDGVLADREPRLVVTGRDGLDSRRARQRAELPDQLAGGVAARAEVWGQDVRGGFEDRPGAGLVVLAHATPPGERTSAERGRPLSGR